MVVTVAGQLPEQADRSSALKQYILDDVLAKTFVPMVSRCTPPLPQLAPLAPSMVTGEFAHCAFVAASKQTKLLVPELSAENILRPMFTLSLR